LPGRQEESKTLHNQPTREEEIVTFAVAQEQQKEFHKLA
jgi:hypothetical protein